MNINSNNLKVERRIKELFYKDKSRVQFTKISQFGLMEISRQRIGQSIYETIYNKCGCCDGSGYKKNNSILIHNIISNIKGIYAIGYKDNIEVNIDEKFYIENSKVINNKIKSMKLSFEVNFITKPFINNIYEFDNDLINKVKNSNKEIIEKIKQSILMKKNLIEEKLKKN